MRIRDASVYIDDAGIKRLWRVFLLNNRFACSACNITWRRKTPFQTLRLRSGKSPTKYTRLFTKEKGLS